VDRVGGELRIDRALAMIERDPDRPRVFGIGLDKTGTSSLSKALTMLGFRSVHNGGRNVCDAVQRAIDADAPLLSNIDPWVDAFSDIGLLSRRYRRLDEQYPGSWFVLTTRPVDEWIVSRRRQVEVNQRRKAARVSTGDWLTIDEVGWRSLWDAHVDGVRAYFDEQRRVGDRRGPRYLEIDLTRNAGWGPLCAFLGRPEPETPYPCPQPTADRGPMPVGEPHARLLARWRTRSASST
jgi:hypothetical protein